MKEFLEIIEDEYWEKLMRNQLKESESPGTGIPLEQGGLE